MNVLSKTVLSGIPNLMMGSVRAEGAGKPRVGQRYDHVSMETSGMVLLASPV